MLRPGGELHIADIGRASSVLMRLAVRPILFLDGTDRVKDNIAGCLQDFMKGAGFSAVVGCEPFKTAFGPLSL